MKIDLTPILNRRVPVINFDFELSPDAVIDAPEISEEITLTEDISVKGRISDNDGYMLLSAAVSVPYETACDRVVEIIDENEVRTVVLGLPRHMNGDIGIRGEISIQFKQMLEELNTCN